MFRKINTCLGVSIIGGTEAEPKSLQSEKSSPDKPEKMQTDTNTDGGVGSDESQAMDVVTPVKAAVGSVSESMPPPPPVAVAKPPIDTSKYMVDPQIGNGKRKAEDQPRDEQGKWTKKPRADEANTRPTESPAEDLLAHLGSSESSQKVEMDKSQLAKMYSEKRTSEDTINELRMQLEEERNKRKSYEKTAKSYEKQSKLSKINELIKNAKDSIIAAKKLKENGTEEEKAFWNDEIKFINNHIEDEDALYAMAPEKIDDINRRTLVLSRASSSFAVEQAKIEGTYAAELKKLSSQIKGQNFDATSGRLRDDTGVTSKHIDSMSKKPIRAPPATSSVTTTHTSVTQTASSAVPTAPTQNYDYFYGAESAPIHIKPFRVRSVCTPDDKNKDLFQAIEQNLSGGGYSRYTKVDTPGITGRLWYEKPVILPGREAVGAGNYFQTPRPGWMGAAPY